MDILKITYRALESVKPDPKNARRHSADQIRALARTIKATGFNVPVLIDRELKVLAGQACVQAAAVIIGRG
ncbi:MAG TPA: ParB N-terminal domain-containing protein [Nitrospiraceae bacterium]|nr:ParB N-terminal domain-containing protein [Nitrospiraceae bacterium]